MTPARTPEKPLRAEDETVASRPSPLTAAAVWVIRNCAWLAALSVWPKRLFILSSVASTLVELLTSFDVSASTS
ncbi:hypothetical protein D3C71_1313560 [compost metagenome]